jgi:methylthioribose-1-phosphate isomerase
MRQPIEALRFGAGVLRALDQTRLPKAEEWLELRDAGEVAAAIRRLSIRGAPLIGVAAAYGVAMSVAELDAACATLVAARPTAANLARAVHRVRSAVLAGGSAPDEARAIHAEEAAASDAMAGHGADLLTGTRRVLTHCNTGALAAPGRGTALAVVAELGDRGELDLVVACETRPLLQGARLTVWELQRLGIAHALIVDGAAAALLAAGEVDAVIVGCDRVAANGDVANKVGTYGHALAAAAAGIPFVVVGPCSTIDPETPDGAAIKIEQRDGDEVRGLIDVSPQTPVRNPAFDVTPAGLVTALVTERGIARPVNAATVAGLVGSVAAP